MNDQHRLLFLLGPQPQYATLKTALKRLNLNTPAALITAGWETDEQEDHAVIEAAKSVGVECVNLNLFSRTEQLFAEDEQLIQTLQDRQDELRHLRNAYNNRLEHLLEAARQILRRPEALIDLQAERESSIEMVRQLDRQYFIRTSQIIDRYESFLSTAERPFVKSHRKEIESILERSGAILISGGHVAIILNRLKIFGILEMRPELPIVAWSGGTMALADQIVFFHDAPPQGKGNPEVLRAGMSLFRDILPLPHAKTRLDLEDRTRVELFARRFKKTQCVVLDEHTLLECRQGTWSSLATRPARRLGANGKVIGMKP